MLRGLDGAHTPAGPAEKPSEKYIKAAKLATALAPKTHYTVDEKQKSILITDDGYEAAEDVLGVRRPPCHRYLLSIRGTISRLKQISGAGPLPDNVCATSRLLERRLFESTGGHPCLPSDGRRNEGFRRNEEALIPQTPCIPPARAAHSS